MSRYVESAIDFLYNNKTTLEQNTKMLQKKGLTEKQIATIRECDNFLIENNVVVFYWDGQDLENGLLVKKEHFMQILELIFDQLDCGLKSFLVDEKDEPLRVIVAVENEEVRYILNNIHRSNITMFGRGCGFMVVDTN